MKNEVFDGKLFALLFIRQWKKIVLWVILGALIIGVPYTLSKTIIGNFDYRSEITMHIEYGEDSSGQMYDYINFYTWNQWITSDNFIDYLTSSYNIASYASAEDFKTSLGATVPADQRVVVFSITSKNSRKTAVMAAALYDCLEKYILTIPEVKSAKIINITEPTKYFVYKSIPQAFVFGALLGLFASALGLWLLILLDDSVYIPEIFEKKYGLVLSEEPAEGELVIDNKLSDLSEIKDSVSLAIKCGAHNGKAISYVLHECEKRDVKIDSVRLTNLDEQLVKAYYFGSKFPNPFMKED